MISEKRIGTKSQTAIVTGASSGIGREISWRLCSMAYTVYGFGREFSRVKKTPSNFHPVICDLLDTEELIRQVKEIRRSCTEIKVLVNNAGVGYYGLHEELNPDKIQEMVRTNLEVPMILTQLLLRDIKKTKGYIFNISSVTAGQSNPHGCAYGATKAGLSNFSRSLFEESRKYGVKVVNIQPDMTQTNFYRNADFCEGEEPESYLLPSEVADAVKYVLTSRESMVVTELSLRPQIHRIRKNKRLSH